MLSPDSLNPPKRDLTFFPLKPFSSREFWQNCGCFRAQLLDYIAQLFRPKPAFFPITKTQFNKSTVCPSERLPLSY